MRLRKAAGHVGMLTGLLLLVAGCAAKSSPAEGAQESREKTAETALQVENHHVGDIVVYLMRGNQPYRLGMVAAVSSAHFTFPYRHIGSTGNARLRADAIGGARSVTSEYLHIQPGQWLRWTLENELRRSFLTVQ
ncbi:MAG TPA: hypothetical protein VH680_10355 [Gemmatimonadales bacterium]|jgi:hypothetical protein